MDRLPPELKLCVAGAVSDLSREAMRALSQTNRQWSQIVAPILYRNFTVSFESTEPQNRVLQLLDVSRILPHVRHLTLLARSSSVSLPVPDENIGDYLEESLPENVKVPLCEFKGDWTPTIHLVKRLPYLQQLNILAFADYAELLDVVAEVHPYCRVSAFTLRRFNPNWIHAQAKWLQYPSLHSVTVVCHDDSHMRRFREGAYRILRDILHQAPHLKYLSLQITIKSSQETSLGYGRWLLRQPTESETTEAPRAKLEMLSLPLLTKMTAEQVERWSWITDLGYLTAWAAGTIEEITALAAITELQPFRALKRLTLRLNQPQDSPNWPQAVKKMFRSLPPLDYLYLLGGYNPAILPTAILKRHGPTLTELKLHYKRTQFQQVDEARRLSHEGEVAPIFPPAVITRIAASCPALRTLCICVQRYRGHPAEARAYDALAQFPALQTLDLVLNCVAAREADGTPSPPRELSAYEQELYTYHSRQIPKWRIRDRMINSAIDESLAKAIFNRIRKGQQGGSLQLLRLHSYLGKFRKYTVSTGISHRVPVRAWEISSQMAGAWQVEWLEDDRLRLENRLKPSRDHEAVIRPQDGEIFESIWPSTREHKTWPLEWCSWPLQ
ncbi:uncharacterized protein BO88DRAFT_479418 [Aspergillus vadensis CBS 113365]|uniref:F-box domain-containing protein n=1 Tax=Aspergillus vadensis (strain CBS 113365 / IMI 142717 / IBT 24658) TaxID=1448311 RepID=A0A319CSH9_ASPVC|nr:hypothetical protein BO88DRAFT_479418 [Aspergillus vadensis CBS 113365]PYH71212.1 hypothetical protein BO88DRAFT_479418 [Aspergillus vadensis CBS 113365]